MAGARGLPTNYWGGLSWVEVGVSPAKEAVGDLRPSSEREWDAQV